MQYQTFSQSLNLILYPLIVVMYIGCSFIDLGVAPDALCLQDSDCNAQQKCMEGKCLEYSTETCDNNDNDLDGMIDEGVLNICGTCGDDVSECDDPMLTCDDLTLAQREQIGQMCELGDEGNLQPGMWSCINAMFVCDPLESDIERCDGIDNDFDGNIDEDLTQMIDCPEMSCRARGEQACENQMIVNNCSTPLASDDASCDGFDDNCNGEIDEDYQSRSILCAESCTWQASTECIEGNEVDLCEVERENHPEVCDLLDNDCDGDIDEGLHIWQDQEEACGLGFCASTYKVRCIDGNQEQLCTDDPELERSEDPKNPLNRQSFFDTCDGVDNDCDGRVDEDSIPYYVSCVDDPMMEDIEVDMGMVSPDMGMVSPDMGMVSPDMNIPIERPTTGIQVCDMGTYQILGCQDPYVDPCIEEGCPQLIDQPDVQSTDENQDGIDGILLTSIFVSFEYGNDEADGDQSRPVRTLTRALELNREWQENYPRERRRDIYMQAGTYTQDPITLNEDVSIYGSFLAELADPQDPTSIRWSKPVIADFANYDQQTILVSTQPMPVFTLVDASVNVILMGIKMTSSDGVNDQEIAFKSPIGLLALKCNHLLMDQVLIESGNGATGLIAGQASPILDPTAFRGEDGVEADGGIGGQSPTCCPNDACRGGNGGANLQNGQDGSGVDEITTAGGTLGEIGNINGSQGIDGTNGHHAQQRQYFYELVNINVGTFHTLTPLAVAGNGVHGAGGGGGAGNVNIQNRPSGGGGGGSGGCGGNAGFSGDGGGWSIAMVRYQTCDLETYRVTLQARNGGNGGQGSPGKAGYVGGIGGTGFSLDSGNGGNGGNGGCGGNGTGGQGGSSVGLIQNSLASVPSGITIITGSAGSGGEAIDASVDCQHDLSSHQGLPGQSLEQICCTTLDQTQQYYQCTPCNNRN